MPPLYQETIESRAASIVARGRDFLMQYAALARAKPAPHGSV
jgi:hypothetical protein